MSKITRNLTPQEICAMYHYHAEYSKAGIGAIEYYKSLLPRDKRFINDMTDAILKAAQQSMYSTSACCCGKAVYGIRHGEINLCAVCGGTYE